MKNLILTSMINYKWKDIEPFFLSLKKSNTSNYECVIFLYNTDSFTKKHIKNYATIIEINFNFIKQMEKHHYFITEYRHILYKQFLKANIKEDILLYDAKSRNFGL